LASLAAGFLTVPLRPDAGADAVEHVFTAAWRLGLKSVAVYREGSKLKQPLTEN
jgi:ribonucleotide reductase alpha subunit